MLNNQFYNSDTLSGVSGRWIINSIIVTPLHGGNCGYSAHYAWCPWPPWLVSPPTIYSRANFHYLIMPFHGMRCYFWGAKVTKTLAHLRWLFAQAQRAWTKCLIAEDPVLINYLFGGDNCLKASKVNPDAHWPTHFIHPSATENERAEECKPVWELEGPFKKRCLSFLSFSSGNYFGAIIVTE